MFRSAYLRLTIYYMTILMALSLAFSVWVYSEAMQEVQAGLRGSVAVQLQSRVGPIALAELRGALEQQYNDSQSRIRANLILLNASVFIVGSAASYMMARRTVQPIEEALEAQNRFTADASHELRTPLAALKTEIEVTLRDPQASKGELKELLKSNLEEIDRMSELTQGLLTLARSGDEPALTVVSASGVASEVCERLQSFAGAKKITISQDLQDVNVLAEPKSLATIISILLENAIKYSPENAGITVVAQRQDGHGLISIKDHGSGIAPAELPRVFERFYRADAARSKETVAGHGLGLSIAQKLITALRGTIQAQSVVGEGSVFTVRLPVA